MSLRWIEYLEVRNGVTIANKSYNPNNNHNSRSQYNKTQENQRGKTWGQKGKDSKITLTQELSYFIPVEFSDSFFKQLANIQSRSLEMIAAS